MMDETTVEGLLAREIQIQAHKNSDVRKQRNEAIEALESIIISLGTKQIGGHYIQNYPIRLNVWRAFATRPGTRLNLIITPNYLVPIKQAGRLIKQGLKIESNKELKQYRLITLSNSIHVRLDLEKLLTGILPVTFWWHNTGAPALTNLIDEITSVARNDGKTELSLLCSDAKIPLEEQSGFLDRASSLIHEDYVAVIRPIAAWAIIQRASEKCNDIWIEETEKRKRQLKELEEIKEEKRDSIENVTSEKIKSDLEIQIAVETERYRLIQRYCEILLNLNKIKGGLDEELEGKGVDKTEAIAFLLKIGELLQKLKNYVPSEKGESDTTLGSKISEFTQPVWSIDVNRRGDWAVSTSRMTVKADAAEQVFGGDTSRISWAVIDSGIDARHPAFFQPPKKCTTKETTEAEDKETPKKQTPNKKTLDVLPLRDTRIKASYDFFRLMHIFKGEYDKLISHETLKELEEKICQPSKESGFSIEKEFGFKVSDPNFKDSDEYLDALNIVILAHMLHMNAPITTPKLTQINISTVFQDEDFSEEALSYAGSIEEVIVSGEPIDWYLMEPLLRIPHFEGHYIPPKNQHGTHVAGILAGSLTESDLPLIEEKKRPKTQQIGICPKMSLYDLRVCNEAGESEEFLVLAAMQFISHLNSNRNLPKVHGANVSLSLRHAVQDYACGQTPICVESNRLVGEGVVVVAAAGNLGFQHLKSDSGNFQAYNGVSITDPGNAADVITVGSTFRDKPHIYGVSYFSSRGPTGDGRQKPDIVAPGERIFSALPDNGFGVLDGTSMAAPHVSGAAALLMARHNELIGDPQRVKAILCDTATDIGRVKEFQGAGLVDIFRAIQSV